MKEFLALILSLLSPNTNQNISIKRGLKVDLRINLVKLELLDPIRISQLKEDWKLAMSIGLTWIRYLSLSIRISQLKEDWKIIPPQWLKPFSSIFLNQNISIKRGLKGVILFFNKEPCFPFLQSEYLNQKRIESWDSLVGFWFHYGLPPIRISQLKEDWKLIEVTKIFSIELEKTIRISQLKEDWKISLKLKSLPEISIIRSNQNISIKRGLKVIMEGCMV